jgi:hypothetical protein
MTDDPDLRLAGFSLWIDGREFPDATDFWDGNWLAVRARMEANGARIECEGSILRTTDIEEFRNQLAAMAETLKGEAALMPLEPELKLVFRMQTRGQVEVTIEITPDHLTQRHAFILDSDQSYLPALVASCDAILARFPITNTGMQE